MSTKVTMNLSARDIENTDKLVALTNSRSKAAAVSTALSVTKLLATRMSKGGEVLIRNKDGKIESLIIPELTEE
ncbi:hypothetical protein ACR720_04680 [Sphingomonas parapaucimobilis]|uniref:hypothetical protein n=1 Tax=Sphingomonas parapaucimobilis TaxID=28213 RepID=UPI0039E7F114